MGHYLWLLLWGGEPTEPEPSTTKSVCVASIAGHSPGARKVQVYRPGEQQTGSYMPGASEIQLECC